MEKLTDGDQVSPMLPRWRLKDQKKKPVCTFIPRVLGGIKMVAADGEIVRFLIHLSLEFEDGSSMETIVDRDELEQMDWSKLDNRCIINSDCRNARKFIANIIRTGLQGVAVETKYLLDRLGIHHIANTVVFFAGSRVITRSSAKDRNISFEIEKMPFSLDIDSNISKREAVEGMVELVNLSPEIGRILVAHVISGVTRRVFQEAGITPCTVMVIVGESGMLKSHYVPHLAQLYNRADGIGAVTRFNSTKCFIEDVLHEYSECTAVIDDLHTAESKAIKRKNEDTAEEIIRRIGDNTGRGCMKGYTQEQKSFQGNAVFIGEYSIGKASTIPRELIVRITKRPNGETLDKYQRNQPLLVSTFYAFFIQWYVDHFDEMKSEIDVRLTRLRKVTANSEVHGRLQDTKFYLQMAYMFFLEFCKDSDFCNRQEALDEYERFCLQLAGLISAQEARFRSNSGMIDYLDLIRKLYNRDRFRVARKKAEFDPDKHEGMICYDCLCLRGKCLERKLRNINKDLNLKDCIVDLLARDALKLVESKNTVQINGTGGKRFYAIKLNKLE